MCKDTLTIAFYKTLRYKMGWGYIISYMSHYNKVCILFVVDRKSLPYLFFNISVNWGIDWREKRAEAECTFGRTLQSMKLKIGGEDDGPELASRCQLANLIYLSLFMR